MKMKSVMTVVMMVGILATVDCEAEKDEFLMRFSNNGDASMTRQALSALFSLRFIYLPLFIVDH